MHGKGEFTKTKGSICNVPISNLFNVIYVIYAIDVKCCQDVCHRKKL